MAAESTTFEEKIPVSAKVAYGGSQGAHNLISGIGLGAIDAFYLKVTNLDPGLMGISWMLFIVWNMINDPLIGILQDRTKTKLGRRIPYLRYGAPIYAITFIWIWFPFADTQILLFLNHLLMLYIFDTVYSMMGLIYYSMPAEMAITAKARGNIMLYSTGLSAIGIVGTIFVPVIFLGNVPQILEFRIWMIIFGIIAGVAIFIGSYYIKENKYTLMEEALGFWESIKQSLKNKPFLILEITIFAGLIMQQILYSYIIFLFDFVVDASMNIFNIFAFVIVFAVLTITVIWLLRNLEKRGLKKLMITGGFVAIVSFIALFIIGISANASPGNKISLFSISLPFSGIAFGLISYLLLSQPMMADCIDNDEILTGKRRETTYAGMNALLTKPAISIGHGIFLWIIDLYGYDENIVDPLLQPSLVSTGILVAFTLVPLICLIIGVISLIWFPLDGEGWNKKKKELHEIHQQKEKKYFEFLKEKGLSDAQNDTKSKIKDKA